MMLVVAPGISGQTDNGKEPSTSSSSQDATSQDKNELRDKTVGASNVHKQSKGF